MKMKHTNYVEEVEEVSGMNVGKFSNLDARDAAIIIKHCEKSNTFSKLKMEHIPTFGALQS